MHTYNICILVYITTPTKHKDTVLFTLFVLAHGDLAARQGLGSQHGGDAAHGQGLARLPEGLDDLLHLGLDGVVLPLHRPVAQVLSHTEAPWRKEGEIGGN